MKLAAKIAAWFGAAGILLAALGCVSSPKWEPLSVSARVHLKAANEAIESGKFDEAREQIKALKALPQTESTKDAVEGMEKRLYGFELGEKIRKISSLKIEPDRLAFGQQAIVTLEIKNPESDPLHIPAPQSAIVMLREHKEGGFYGRLTEIAVATDAYGNQIRDKSEKTFSTQEEIIIAPGQSWIQQSRISPKAEDAVALRNYQIIYFLRAPRILVGDHETSLADLRIGPASLQAMPAGYEKLSSDPISSLKKALATPGEQFDAHVFLCSVLTAPTQQKEAVIALIQGLETREAQRQRAAMAGLRWITGNTENGFEADRWRAWWEQHRKEYEEPNAG